MSQVGHGAHNKGLWVSLVWEKSLVQECYLWSSGSKHGRLVGLMISRDQKGNVIAIKIMNSEIKDCGFGASDFLSRNISGTIGYDHRSMHALNPADLDRWINLT